MELDLNDPGCRSNQDNTETYEEVTTITINENVVQSDVKRLGINIGGPSNQIRYFQNLMLKLNSIRH